MRIGVREKMTPLLRKLLGLNWVLVLTMYGMLVFGIYSIESAARHLSTGGEVFADRQKLWVLVGSVVYFVTALIDYRWIRWLALPMYLGGLAMMGATLVAGNEVHQLSVAGINFQPAQFAIVAGFIILAWLIQDMPKLHPLLGLPFVKMGVISICAIIPFVLVAMMGDMGSAIVWIPVVTVVMLVGGVPWRYLIFLALIGLAALPPLYFIVLPKVSERGTERIELYLDTLNGKDVDISGAGYAQHYVTTEIGSAGYHGKGWMASKETGSLHARRYIPYKTAHNDFIFAIIGGEQGFKGSLLLVMFFSLLMILCLFTAFYSRDMSGQIIVSAVVALFFAHMFENIGMCIGLTPITGIPLPLISYSGTFVVMCMFMLGLVQSVWVHRNHTLPEEKEEPFEPSTRGKRVVIGKRRGQSRENPNSQVQRGVVPR